MYFFIGIICYYLYGTIRFIYIYIRNNNTKMVESVMEFNDSETTNIII